MSETNCYVLRTTDRDSNADSKVREGLLAFSRPAWSCAWNEQPWSSHTIACICSRQVPSERRRHRQRIDFVRTVASALPCCIFRNSKDTISYTLAVAAVGSPCTPVDAVVSDLFKKPTSSGASACQYQPRFDSLAPTGTNLTLMVYSF